MTCTICHTDKDNIEPKTDNFPICVDCVDDKVFEIAERKKVEKTRTGGKQEIANQIWEIPPKEGLKAIYTVVRSFCRELVSGDLVPLDKQQVYDYYGIKKENVTKLADMWNNGYTWIDKLSYDKIMGA